MPTSKLFPLGYDLDAFNDYGDKAPITTPITPDTNSHMLFCGMSGSGKSYFQTQIFARLAKADLSGEFYFADYKAEDAFAHLRDCPRYLCYGDTLHALDAVYTRLNARLSGEDETRNPVTLIWDEYMANILALTNKDKKLAAVVKNQVSEILLMGRSKSIRLIVSCQRPDAEGFPVGSRLNYGVVVILGAAVQSIYEMLMPDHMDKVKGREFGQGEGTVLLQGSHLHFIKVPQSTDIENLQAVCRGALS
jgi:adenylate kinase family enzyme